MHKSTGPLPLTKELLKGLAANSDYGLSWPAGEGNARDAVDEMIHQRILSCEGEWDFGSSCSLGPAPIVGETPEERLAKLPDLPELPRWMIFTGNLLIGIDALLFFIFYCTYLPQSWVAPVTGTGALIGALLSYAGLRLSDQKALTALHWTGRKWLAVLIVGSLLATLTCVGYLTPCVVYAPPGAEIWVDGKRVATVPEIKSENPIDWQTNTAQRVHLRWDPHDIQVRKKWWETGDWHEASVASIELDWTHPRRLFAKWNATAQLTPLLRIISGLVSSPNPTDAAPSAEPGVEDGWKAAVAGWDAGLQALLAGYADESMKPMALRVEVRARKDNSGTLNFALFSFKGEMLRPFLPFPIRDVSDRKEMDQARDRVFNELENELQIRSLRLEGPNLAVAARAEIQYVAQTLPQKPLVATSAESTSAALRKLASEMKLHPASANEKSTALSLWNSAAVANEAFRLGYPEQAASVATEMSKVGEAAATTGRIETAKIARSSLAQIADVPGEGPPDIKATAGLSASQSRLASAIAVATPRPGVAKPRVFLHINGESQRANARQIQTALEQGGFTVPGIQNVLGRAYIPDTAEVRYFVYPRAQAKAGEILKILKETNCKDARSSFVKPSANDVATSTDIATHFEVWFGKNSFGQ